LHAFSNRRVESLDARQRQFSLRRRRDDGRGKGVLAVLFEAGGGLQEAVLARSVQDLDRTFSIRSRDSALLMRTPAPAPRPTPTMIDIGVARPSAQGQAMISTLTAATSP
jgi:hypothetical protein